MGTHPLEHNEDADTPSPAGSTDICIGASVLPEHRAILEAALAQHPERPLYEVLASMPDVGEDSDFARYRG